MGVYRYCALRKCPCSGAVGRNSDSVLGAIDKAVNPGGCKSFYRQLPENGRLAYPLLGEVTNQDMRGSKSHGCLETFSAVGAIGVASKPAGLSKPLSFGYYGEGPWGKATAASRIREIRPSGMKGGLRKRGQWMKLNGHVLRERRHSQSFSLKLRAPYFYPITIARSHSLSSIGKTGFWRSVKQVTPFLVAPLILVAA